MACGKATKKGKTCEVCARSYETVMLRKYDVVKVCRTAGEMYLTIALLTIQLLQKMSADIVTVRYSTSNYDK